jgi:hypothetical protein
MPVDGTSRWLVVKPGENRAWKAGGAESESSMTVMIRHRRQNRKWKGGRSLVAKAAARSALAGEKLQKDVR